MGELAVTRPMSPIRTCIALTALFLITACGGSGPIRAHIPDLSPQIIS